MCRCVDVKRLSDAGLAIGADGGAGAHLRGRDAHAKFGGKYWRERFNHKILTNFVP